ncbi:hypothetical protein CSOJ01_02972 [Colletotrichum sojae]|uniref:Uncharacterized protein n=1 Tax=Colletotrichum sojae TaxID=2175907 RepID=A0A8H6N0Z2_9PEZI|nr:hypothetical protein CSOJ01_02972 [Colletotrichum sojae]
MISSLPPPATPERRQIAGCDRIRGEIPPSIFRRPFDAKLPLPHWAASMQDSLGRVLLLPGPDAPGNTWARLVATANISRAASAGD